MSIITRKASLIYVAGLISAILLFAPPAFAQEFTSSNFRISAPVIAVPGGYGASSNFQLYGALQQPAIGESTITNFDVKGGFLYYPYVNAPVATAAAGDAQVTVTWTASVGALGWTVGGYNVGRSTTAGSGYAYTSVGNVLTTTVTGLTNGTTYYFVVRAEDAFSNSIVTSNEVSATPAGTGGGDEGGGGGGGNGNGPPGPAPQPLYQQIIEFILGKPEPAPPSALPGCDAGTRSDFNCDTDINLSDFSILLSQPKLITGKALSLLFANWTAPLPIPRPDAALPRALYETSPLNAFAQASNILAPQATGPVLAPTTSTRALSVFWFMRLLFILLLLLLLFTALLWMVIFEFWPAMRFLFRRRER
ncbi:MAG: hypothetical protein Q7R85_00375 [bacterium]|nr:hypothetical protein [bacterium]